MTLIDLFPRKINLKKYFSLYSSIFLSLRIYELNKSHFFTLYKDVILIKVCNAKKNRVDLINNDKSSL